MATIKAYSVAKTEKGYGSAVADSGVYSLSPAEVGAGQTGRNGAYDHPTVQGLTEGRVKTLLNGSRTATTPVTGISAVTTSASNPEISSAIKVVATTTTLSGNGAGLIISFTTTAAGAINGTPGNYFIVDGGEGYAASDTVEVDGFPGSKLTVSVS